MTLTAQAEEKVARPEGTGWLGRGHGHRIQRDCGAPRLPGHIGG